MALSVIQPNEVMPVKAIKIYVYGDPSMGKSSLGMTGKNVLLIDADKGAYRTGGLRRAPVQLAENWFQVANLNEQDLQPFDTIAIDTVQRLLEVIKAHLAAIPGNTKNDGALKLNVQGVANNLFQGFVNKMIEWGKNVIFLAHATEDKDGDDIIHRPDLGGKNRQEIYRLSDCMAYFTHEHSGRGKPKRLLKFSRGTDYHSKDCANLGDIEVPDLANHPNFIGELIDHIKDHLNTLSPEQKLKIEQEQSWLHWQQLCDEAKYPSDFTAMTEDICQEKESPYYKQMWNYLKQSATKHGFTYNKDEKKWYAPIEG